MAPPFLPDLAPRAPLARWPSPLEPSPRFGPAAGIALLRERGDLTGLEPSGDEARELESLVAGAEASAAHVLVTCGGARSSRCRASAFAEARSGSSRTPVASPADRAAGWRVVPAG